MSGISELIHFYSSKTVYIDQCGHLCKSILFLLHMLYTHGERPLAARLVTELKNRTEQYRIGHSNMEHCFIFLLL